jgi:hypothetical protein
MRIISISPSLLSYRNGGRWKMDREGRCRMCLEPRRKAGVRMLTRHHLVPRSWFAINFGDPLPYKAVRVRDCDANMIPLCVRCHDAVETDSMARAMLRKVLGQNEVAFGIQLRGKDWFDRRYPVFKRLPNASTGSSTGSAERVAALAA